MSRAILAAKVKLKRAYAPASRTDGARRLIDRLWPRGIKKTDAHLDGWMKEIAPSSALRKWFSHEPGRWPEFRRRYELEIQKHPEQLARLRALARADVLTLVFSARDVEHNDAVVLRRVILGRPRLRSRKSAVTRTKGI